MPLVVSVHRVDQSVQHKDLPTNEILAVDLDNDAVSGLQPSYVSHSNWTVEADFEFLDPASSNALLRAFYVPGVSRRFTKYNRYSTVYSTVQYSTVQQVPAAEEGHSQETRPCRGLTGDCCVSICFDFL